MMNGRGARRSAAEFVRGLEISMISAFAGSAYLIYGGLINWWPFGSDPHFPTHPFIMVYLSSLGFALIIDAIAHPAAVKEAFREAQERSQR